MTRLFRFLLLLLAAGAVQAANMDDLLEPEKAFRMSTRALDARTVEVRFAIADGYYMYRERFRFALEPGSKAQLGAPQFPPGNAQEGRVLRRGRDLSQGGGDPVAGGKRPKVR